MRKWLVIGLILLGMVWGPYVYTELSRSPQKSHGRGRHGFHMFGDDDDEPAAGAPAPEPAEPSAEPSAEKKPEEPQPSAATTPEPKAAAPSPEPEKAVAADPPDAGAPRPSWPAALLPAFRKTFDSEPRDAFWAQAEEPKLRALFHGAGVTDDSLVTISCLKSVCRIAFDPGDLDADVENKIFEAIQKTFPEAFALDPEHGEAHASLFVLRDGYKLEH
jgi:hypothetical protein